jgi:phage shock protein C
MSAQQSERGRTILIIAGVGLMAYGAWALAGQSGLVPAWLYRNWSELRGGLGLILVGAIVIYFSRGGLKSPAPGARLYRTREDKWVAGVLGGLGRYFGIEPTLLRLLFIVLVALGAGWPVVGYIVMAILVPKEPEGAAIPVVPAPSAPPVEPVPESLAPPVEPVSEPPSPAEAGDASDEAEK